MPRVQGELSKGKLQKRRYFSERSATNPFGGSRISRKGEYEVETKGSAGAGKGKTTVIHRGERTMVRETGPIDKRMRGEEGGGVIS